MHKEITLNTGLQKRLSNLELHEGGVVRYFPQFCSGT